MSKARGPENAPSVLIGGGAAGQVRLLGRMANRHGLVTGATGTGKTVTLQILAEGFSRLGVPVFATDIKGDLSGVAHAGKTHPRVSERIERIGIDNFEFAPSPTAFWDLFGKAGTRVRMAISELGPLLLSRLFDLNETQSGVLYATFRVADDNGLLLLDLKDLRSMLAYMGEHAKELRLEYGNISAASIGAIQRRLLALEEQGAEHLFGEPALEIGDLMRTDESGRGIVNLLDATQLVSTSPALYACFLFWLLSELYETLPERGDPDVPELVLFFDEAHLLFDHAPRALLDKIEQVVRLIRSKGVGVIFVTQSPLDIPDGVLGQLGLKIQHALRAYTPRERKAVKIIAESFPTNPDIDTVAAITDLGTGEALVSVLDADGRPQPVERTLVRPPESQIGPITNALRAQLIASGDVHAKYVETIDRESAYETLLARTEERSAAAAAAPEKTRRPRSNRQGIGEAFVKSTLRSVGSQIGRQLVRGLLGSLLGGRR